MRSLNTFSAIGITDMPNRVTKDEIVQSQAAVAGPTVEAVLNQLERILSSDDFRNTKRLSAFLKYIVNEKLAGRENQIKGYTIAITVYERDHTFNPEEDPIIRIDAGRMRRALEHYYHTEGKNDPIRINVPKGGYVPTFEQIDLAPTTFSDRRAKNASVRDYQETLPALLIQPVQYAGTDNENINLAESLSKEFIIAFGRISYLRTLSATMLPEFKDKNFDALQLALKHNIRFALTGSLNKLGQNMRLHIQLFDTANGEQLWGDHFELPLSQHDIASELDKLIKNLVAHVADFHNGAIFKKLVHEMRNRPQNLRAHDAILLGNYFDLDFSKQAYMPWREALKRAVENYPDSGACWANLAKNYLDNYIYDFIPESKDVALKKAAKAMRRAQALAPMNEMTLWVSASYGVVTRNIEAVRESTSALLKLGPSPSLCCVAGAKIAIAGEWQRGMAILNEQLGKLHFYPRLLHWALFLDAYRQNDYEKALVEANRMNAPGNCLDPLMHAAALGQLGRAEEARTALDQLLTLCADYTQNPREHLAVIIMQDDLVEHVLEGLYKAGL